MLISYKKYKDEALKNPEIRKAYEENAVEFYVADQLIGARIKAKMTQEQVAAKMKTSQPAIARIENGEKLPSLSTIMRYIEATQQRIVLDLRPKDN